MRMFDGRRVGYSVAAMQTHRTPIQEKEEIHMADPNNPGQFGNRSDTEEQAQKGGQQSPGQFGASEGADPHDAGSKGAQEQPQSAKVRGGEHSHTNT